VLATTGALGVETTVGGVEVMTAGFAIAALVATGGVAAAV
jgi:hypothetical protein